VCEVEADVLDTHHHTLAGVAVGQFHAVVHVGNMEQHGGGVHLRARPVPGFNAENIGVEREGGNAVERYGGHRECSVACQDRAAMPLERARGRGGGLDECCQQGHGAPHALGLRCDGGGNVMKPCLAHQRRQLPQGRSLGMKAYCRAEKQDEV